MHHATHAQGALLAIICTMIGYKMCAIVALPEARGAWVQREWVAIGDSLGVGCLDLVTDARRPAS